MFFLKKTGAKRKFYLSLLSALLLFSIVPVLILSVLTYKYSSDLLKDEMNTSMQILLEQLQEKHDTDLENIRDDVLGYITYSSNITPFVFKSNPKDFYLTHYLCSDLKQLKSNHPYIEDIVVYIKDINFIMNDEGSMRTDFYFNQFQSKDFFDLLKNNGFWETCYIDDYRTMSKTFKAVLFYSTLPKTSINPNIFLSVAIDKQRLEADIMEFNLTQEGETFIIDEQNNLIVSFSAAEKLDFNRVKDILADAEDNSKIMINQEAWQSISVVSPLTKWRYLTLIPCKEITDKTKSIGRMTFFLCIVVLILAFITSLLSTRRLYIPIDSLINKIIDTLNLQIPQPQKRKKRTDEFSFIDKNIDQMLLQNQDLQYQILKSVPLIQQSFLKELLHGLVDFEDIEQKLDTYSIRLPNRYFTVFLFYNKDKADRTDIIHQAFKDGFANYYIINEPSFVTVLLNFNECDKSRIISRFSTYPIVIAQGAIYEAVGDIVKSYKQAMYVFQYRTSANRSEYLAIADLLNMDFSKHKLPAQFEEQYQNCIELSEFDSAFQIIQNIVDCYITFDTPYFYVQKSVEKLHAFAEKIGERYHISLTSMVKAPMDSLVWKDGSRTIEEDRAYILQLYTKLLDYQINSYIPKDDEAIRRVLEVIEDQYLEDISLEQIADTLQISYSYLSKSFKKQIGEGFVEYITRKRIERSIELLKNTSLSVDKISSMVGYINTPTYIRNFKKVEGVSPGKYRNLL